MPWWNLGGGRRRRGGGENDPINFLSLEDLREALRRCIKKRQELQQKYEGELQKILEKSAFYKKEAARLLTEKDNLRRLLKEGSGSYAMFWRCPPGVQSQMADVISPGGSIMRLTFLVSNRDVKDVKAGSLVLVGEGVIIGVLDEFWPQGEVVFFESRLDEDTVLVKPAERDGAMKMYLAPEFRKTKFKEGDPLLSSWGLVLQALPRKESKEHVLDIQEVNVDWSEIGGLSRTVRKIQRVLLPFQEREAYAKLFKGSLPRGMILHGPEGCGKTKCAKAVATYLAKAKGLKCYFISLAGAQLVSKWVGETARHIRKVFSSAKEKAKDGSLVLIFIDEVDSLFRSRDTAEHEPWMATDIGQFNALLDGMDSLGNILVIGATNRKDLVDKAILRPGRLGIDVYIPRPQSEKDIREILSIYLTADLPFAAKYFESDVYVFKDYFDSGREKQVSLDMDPEKVRQHFIDVIVKRLIYDGPPLTVTFEDDGQETATINNRFRASTPIGDREILLRKELSGAVLENIVTNAKLLAFERYTRRKNQDPNVNLEITKKDFFRAIDEEMERLKNNFRVSSQKPIAGFQQEINPDS